MVYQFRNLQILYYPIITKFYSIARHKQNNPHNFTLNDYNLQSFYRSQISSNARRGSGGIAVYIKDHLVRGVEKVCDGNLKLIDDRV